MTTAPFAATSVSTDDPRPLDEAKDRERTPWLLGFLCVLIGILPAYLVPAGPLKSNGSPAKVIALLIFGLTLLGFVLVRRTSAARTIRPGVVIILLYFLLQLVIAGVGFTSLGNGFVEDSKVRELINQFAGVGVALYILTRIRTARQRDFLLGALAIGLTFACLVGLLQSMNIELRYLFEPPGFVVNTDAVEMGERWGAKRSMGTSQHAIEFSVLAAITVPLTIYFARNATRRSVRWAAALGCGLAVASMPGAISRTGIIALAAALLLYMWNFKVRHLAVGVVALGLAFFVYKQVFPDIANALWNTVVNSEDDPSVLHRTGDYAIVSQTFQAHPLFGLGLGASPPTEYGYLDNEWLQVIVQGGVIGVLALTVLIGGGIFGITAALRSATSPRERDQAYMLGAMLVAIAATSTTFDLLNFAQVTRIFFIIFGLLWANYTVSFQGPTTPARSSCAREQARERALSTPQDLIRGRIQDFELGVAQREAIFPALNSRVLPPRPGPGQSLPPAARNDFDLP
jgi:polysaccharide biosynthesis protein PslJ